MAKTLETRESDAAFGRGWLRDTWYFAILGRDLRPGRPLRVEILGEPVMLARRRDGGVWAVRDLCPHRAAPLSAGQIVRDAAGVEAIECPFHGWRFGVDGACAHIPSLTADQDLDPSRIRVRTYPVRETQGLVFLWMASDPRGEIPPDHEPPVFPGVVGGGPKIVDSMYFESHIDHAVVGLMDPAHGPYVHRNWWWRSPASQHDKAKTFEAREHGFAMVRHPPSRNSYAYRALGGAPETEIVFRLPGLRYEHVRVGSRQLLSLTCLTPATEVRTRITQMLWSDHPAVTALRPFIALGARRFLRQDADMVNLQNLGLAHESRMLFIDDADRQAKWYQALKREWAASRKEARPFENPVEGGVLRWRS